MQMLIVLVCTTKIPPGPLYFTHKVPAASSMRLYIEQISLGLMEAATPQATIPKEWRSRLQKHFLFITKQ